MAVINVNSSNFNEEALNADKPVVVDFWAPWCGYCRRLNPVIERLSEQYDGKIVVEKLNVDDSHDLADKYGVDTIPTLILFKGGNAGKPLINPGSQTEIESWLKENGAL